MFLARELNEFPTTLRKVKTIDTYGRWTKLSGHGVTRLCDGVKLSLNKTIDIHSWLTSSAGYGRVSPRRSRGKSYPFAEGSPANINSCTGLAERCNT